VASVPANIAYPTDSGLLAKGVAKLARSVSALKSLGFATRASFRDRTRAVRRRAHSIGAWLRRRTDEAREEVLKITGELAGIAEVTVADALAVARNAKRSIAQAGKSAPGKAALWSPRSNRRPSSWSRSSPRAGPGRRTSGASPMGSSSGAQGEASGP
jgi:hypothetical protein